MARFLFVLLLTGMASYAALAIMPWWTPMLIAFALCLSLRLKRGTAFLAAGLGAGLTYLLLSALADNANDHLLGRKMAVLFGLPSPLLLWALTALAGFMTAGLGGLCGASLRTVFKRARPETAPLEAPEEH